ncbi:MAG: SusD/RagB family nutrient-binding outer membrane lipoprotein [Phycisphaerae bacterium]|nr:SusD/RagB family nutrient-binding outer membrane lipoprotein [Saprospiraceae bacterium]
MKHIKYLFSLLLVIVAANSCQKFDDLEADPNRSTEVPPGLVFRGILKDMYHSPWNAEQRWNQYWCSNYNYYDINEYWTGSANLNFSTLKNVQKMEEEAARTGLPSGNSFATLGIFFRAYFYYEMTMKVGDLPLGEALQGEGNIYPAYASQKDIFKEILVWLDECNTELTTLIAGAQTSNDAYYLSQSDFYFKGDLSKWQKTVNTFKLRVLIQLSKKVDSESDLNLKTEFAKILGDTGKYPIMGSSDDNLQYLFNSSSDKYPFSPDNYGRFVDRYNTSATYVNTLSTLHDPRVFVVAEPAVAKLNAGYTPQDYEAYVGAPSDESLDVMSTKAQGGEYSRINYARFFATYIGEPSIQIGYPELCFNIAEGIHHGWASGNAQDWYNKGITASMATYGITDPTVLSNYLTQTSVAYRGNNVDGLTQILVQKYLALAQHSGLEAYYNWRRTAQPFFYQGGPGTGNSGVIPRRFQYPTSERDNNTVNYNAALERQFGNKDDSVNDELWIVK